MQTKKGKQFLSDEQIKEIAQRPIADDEWELIWQICDEYEAELERLHAQSEEQRIALLEAYEY